MSSEWVGKWKARNSTIRPRYRTVNNQNFHEGRSGDGKKVRVFMYLSSPASHFLILPVFPRNSEL